MRILSEIDCRVNQELKSFCRKKGVSVANFTSYLLNNFMKFESMVDFENMPKRVFSNIREPKIRKYMINFTVLVGGEFARGRVRMSFFSKPSKLNEVLDLPFFMAIKKEFPKAFLRIHGCTNFRNDEKCVDKLNWAVGKTEVAAKFTDFFMRNLFLNVDKGELVAVEPEPEDDGFDEDFFDDDVEELDDRFEDDE